MCEVCKPNRQSLNVDVRSELATIANLDSDLTVRDMAQQELAELRARLGA